MRFPSSLVRAAAAAAFLAASAVSHAAYLDGTTVSYSFLVKYPDGYLQTQVAPTTAVVGSGVEFDYFGPFSGVGRLDVSDTSISGESLSSPAFFPVGFQKMVFSFDTSLAPLQSVSFGSDTSSVFLRSDVLSFDAHNVYVNVNDMQFQGGERFSINLVPAPVPEPETYAMALAGLGVVGLTALRRRGAKRAIQA